MTNILPAEGFYSTQPEGLPFLGSGFSFCPRSSGFHEILWISLWFTGFNPVDFSEILICHRMSFRLVTKYRSLLKRKINYESFIFEIEAKSFPIAILSSAEFLRLLCNERM